MVVKCRNALLLLSELQITLGPVCRNECFDIPLKTMAWLEIVEILGKEKSTANGVSKKANITSFHLPDGKGGK